MKKFKFLPPYKSPGKTMFPEIQRRSGVYLIKENAKLVYVGMSGGNLYKTLYRHFEAWNHPDQEVVSYQSRMKKNKYTVRCVLCKPGQAARLEKYLILKFKPRDNEIKYNNYQLSAFDESIFESYDNAPTINEVPF
ncbi:MAG: hypothetical protein WC285_06485 [Candidatus Gracilibacteria bacterium]|jgi:excinuclease UvrABC nuclease subunit